MSFYILPCLIIIIIIFSLFNKSKLYDAFVDGCLNGFNICLKIAPILISMFLATNLLNESGLLNNLFVNFTFFPFELIVQSLFKLLSHSASLLIMIDIYNKYGVDSKTGIVSTIIQNSSDTVFYIIFLYYGFIKKENPNKSIFIGILINIVCLLIALIIYSYFL